MTVAAESSGSVAGVRRTAATLGALVRLPNLFTAPPDVVAGAALAFALGATVDSLTVAGLCVASVLIYAAGTTLNDVADAAEDERDRPERPIPSGAIDRRTAALVGVGLLGCGVVVAAAGGGVRAGLTAVALAVAVVLYDFALKGGPAGPFAMGAARGLNVALGLSVASVTLPPRVVVVPLVLAAYVAALTWLAESETASTDRDRVPVVVTAAAAVSLAIVLTAVVRSFAGVPTTALAAFVAAGFVVWVGRPLIRAYADPTPGTVGPAIGAAVLGIVLADAAAAAVIGPVGTVLAAAFLVPAVGLARRFDVT